MDVESVRKHITNIHPDWTVNAYVGGQTIFIDIRVAKVLTYFIEISPDHVIGVSDTTNDDVADGFMGPDEFVKELDQAIAFIEEKIALTSDLDIDRLLNEAKQRKIDEAKYGGVISIREQIDAIRPGWVNAVFLSNKMYFASVVVLEQRFDIKLGPRRSIAVREYRKEDECNNSKLLADRDYDVEVETLNEALAYIETQLVSSKTL